MARRILHLDLDAFFAAVEQRDKPSLRGRPVVVGGAGPRGVVATASYEARRFGVRSAMSGAEAKRRAPHAAFLGGRFEAYRESSRIVMALLGEISAVVEPLSFDEAFVDLAGTGWADGDLTDRVTWLRAELTRRTEGLTASVGVGSAKFLAKLASEAAKPDGARILEPGEELNFIAPMPVRAIPGVGPATEQRLITIGLYTVEDLRTADRAELIRELGPSAGESLAALAWGRDDRAVEGSREPKSISTEDTFAVDLTDRAQLQAILRRDAGQVAARLAKAGLFARTVTVKVRFADFTTRTIARGLGGATDSLDEITAAGLAIFDDVDPRPGVRLLGIGVSNFATAAQERLFGEDPADGAVEETTTDGDVELSGVRGQRAYHAGADVVHDELGRGWVWGSGLGRVTVRFETRATGPGQIRTFALDDASLRPAGIYPLAHAPSTQDEAE